MDHQCHVLVTGGSGFIAGHCILQLLQEGHRVRAPIRSPDKAQAAWRVLAGSGMVHAERLSFVVADLLHDEGWADAASGVDTVLHVASPVHPGAVACEDELIVPAVEGSLRVLRAARDAGVGRVVLTSAFHAVGWVIRTTITSSPKRIGPFSISSGPPLSLREIASIIQSKLGADAGRVSTRELPNIAVRILALFRAEMRPIVRDLGHAKKTSNEKARRVLGWQPGASRDAIIAAARSIIEQQSER